MNDDVYTKLLEELEKVIGFDACHTLMKELGRETGKRFAKYYGKIRIDEKMVNNFFSIQVASGWMIKLDETSYDSEEQKVLVRCKSVISKYHKESKNSVCSFLSGMFEEGFTVFLGKKMKCVETNCIAKGDEYDKFILVPEE